MKEILLQTVCRSSYGGKSSFEAVHKISKQLATEFNMIKHVFINKYLTLTSIIQL